MQFNKQMKKKSNIKCKLIIYNCKQMFHRSKKIFLCLGHVGVKKNLRLI